MTIEQKREVGFYWIILNEKPTPIIGEYNLIISKVSKYSDGIQSEYIEEKYVWLTHYKIFGVMTEEEVSVLSDRLVPPKTDIKSNRIDGLVYVCTACCKKLFVDKFEEKAIGFIPGVKYRCDGC